MLTFMMLTVTALLSVMLICALYVFYNLEEIDVDMDSRMRYVGAEIAQPVGVRDSLEWIVEFIEQHPEWARENEFIDSDTAEAAWFASAKQVLGR